MESRITGSTTTTAMRYQYDNHLGSACLELSANGEVISYEEYHPFGTTSYYTSDSSINISLKQYKYCGKERDEETGLYYYGMRYYADWLCRFVSVDPLQFEYPELTPFQYASNNPVTMIDLDGLEGVDPQEDKEVIDLNNSETAVQLPPVTVSSTLPENANTDWRSLPLSDGSGYMIRAGGQLYRSSTDLWRGVPEGLSGYNGYTYTLSDLMMRQYIMENGSRVMRESIRNYEKQGWAEPLTGKNFWDLYGQSKGSAIVMAKMFSMGFELIAGSAISGAAKGTSIVPKSFNPKSILPSTNAAKGGTQLSTRFVSTSKGITDLQPTLNRIATGGKFPHIRDGSVFRNAEGLLPKQNIGHYLEFVHPTLA